MVKIKDEIKQDLLLIVDETKKLLEILKYKIQGKFIKKTEVLHHYYILDDLISDLDPALYYYNELLIKIANEVRLLLLILRDMTFSISDVNIINQYYKLRDMLIWFDWILHYYDQFKTLPPKYDYKPKQEG